MPHNTRKAPTASATLFKRGTVKVGNDGNKWTIVADTRGVQRWKKITANSKPRTVKHRRVDPADAAAASESVWGKNKPLEQFWRKLASGKKVVIIYRNAAAESRAPSLVSVPASKTAMKAFFDKCDADENIVAVLSSNMSQNAYEDFLYPKARDSTVQSVIDNYKKYFKSTGVMPADMIEKGFPEQKKVLYPA
jgi:hypothetical protein